MGLISKCLSVMVSFVLFVSMFAVSFPRGTNAFTCANYFTDFSVSEPSKWELFNSPDSSTLVDGLLHLTTTSSPFSSSESTYATYRYKDIISGDFIIELDVYKPSVSPIGDSVITNTGVFIEEVDAAGQLTGRNMVGVEVTWDLLNRTIEHLAAISRAMFDLTTPPLYPIYTTDDFPYTVKITRTGTSVSTYYKVAGSSSFVLLDTFSTAFGSDVQVILKSDSMSEVVHSATATLGAFSVVCPGSPLTPTQTYRFFNRMNGAHLYTISTSERDTVMGLTNEWSYEGEKFHVFQNINEGLVPVYRFWNAYNGAHLYTISTDEKNTIIGTLPQFTYEGVKFFVYEEIAPATLPVYRFFNSRNGAHLYTISEEEKATILATLPYFSYEGIAFYVK